jgi:hypothetical protein
MKEIQPVAADAIFGVGGAIADINSVEWLRRWRMYFLESQTEFWTRVAWWGAVVNCLNKDLWVGPCGPVHGEACEALFTASIVASP